MIGQRVLKQLSDQGWHTGASMGEALGIGRSAIWKQIEELRALGLQIEADKNRGYRLLDDVALIDVEAIHAHSKHASDFSIETHHSIDSTNNRAMQIIQSGELTAPFAVFADHQSAGRGRRGRTWVSPIGRSLYFSVGWTFEQGLNELSGLSLVVAIALRRALINEGVDSALLKWPNDLLGSINGTDYKKLAGVLIEIQGEATGPCSVVIGVGLNISLSDCVDDSLSAIDQPWIDLKTLCNGASLDRNQLAASVLEQLTDCLQMFQDVGFTPFKQAWLEGDFMFGREVSVLIGDKVAQGEHMGVDDDGNLLLAIDGVTTRFNAGEVSLRL